MRSYDSLNSRASAVFAFSTAVLTTSPTALKELAAKFSTKVSAVFFVLIFVCFTVMAFYAIKAYIPRNRVKTLPDSKKLYGDLHDKSESDAKISILYNVLESETNGPNELFLSEKGRALNRAIIALYVEIIILFIALSAPYLWR